MAVKAEIMKGLTYLDEMLSGSCKSSVLLCCVYVACEKGWGVCVHESAIVCLVGTPVYVGIVD